MTNPNNDKGKLFAKFVDMNYVRTKTHLVDKSTIDDLVEITITKEDGSHVSLGNEYKQEYFHGRSPYEKYLNEKS